MRGRTTEMTTTAMMVDLSLMFDLSERQGVKGTFSPPFARGGGGGGGI